MNESELPSLLQQGLAILKTNGREVRVDALADNWIYLWVPGVAFDEKKYPPPNSRGVWVRIPLQFPYANPHGIITSAPLNPLDGHPVRGHNANHDMCNPVKTLGGVNYYSWTWTGELGEGPSLKTAQDIMSVIAWVERRIRQA